MRVSPSHIPEHGFIRDDENSVPFKLEAIAHQTNYTPDEPHRHNYYEIFLFREGGGHHMIDFNEVPIHSNSLHFISPGQVHQVKRNMDSSGWVIMFSREFYYANLENKELLFDLHFFNNKVAKPSLTLSPPDFEKLKHLVQQIEDEYPSKDAVAASIIRNYLNILLLKCNAWFNEQNGPSHFDDNPILNRLKSAIEQHYLEKQQVQDYASLLSITPNHLNDTVKKLTGKNASDFIHERIILEAKRLLHHSEMSTKEIAYYLNFNDPGYFSRYVKRYLGQSPKAFRKAIREKYHF